MDFYFVILHYLTDQDTIQCIDSIEKLKSENKIQIIVVDNFSNNGSIEKIEEYTKCYLNVRVLKNSKNLGFANGNNVGYIYAKSKSNNCFIVVLNNDTIIKQEDFIERIENRFKNEKFAVLGPDIISLEDGGHQNPLSKIPNKRQVRQQIIRYSLLLLLSKMGLYILFQHIFAHQDKSQKNKTERFDTGEVKNRALQGSCIIFSPLFVKTVEEPFCPDTFLYKEEFILALNCKKRGLEMFYDADIKIFHKEDSSTNQKVSNQKEKREFTYKNLINSDKILLKYI